MPFLCDCDLRRKTHAYMAGVIRKLGCAPIQIGGVADRRDGHRPAADVDRRVGCPHLSGKAAMHGIESKKMGIGFHRPQIVDRHDLDIPAARFDDRAQHIAADASESVDRYLDSHVTSLSR